MENRKKILMKLFVSTLYLSAFTFGGGYVIVTLMKKKFVDEYHWIEENEMLDLVAIAQSAPGPIAVNGAIVVGYKLAGMTGVVTAIIGTIIPPFLIISLISVCYNVFRDNFIVSQMLSGMQAGVAAVIASVTYEMGAGIVHGEECRLHVHHGWRFSCFLRFSCQRRLRCHRLRADRRAADTCGGKESKKMIYLQLFLSFLQIGMFSFGGGYAAMPLIQGQVVTAHHWLSMEEFTDLITISQMTPGPIAVNSATFVGTKIAGTGGALAATFGCILPSCIIVTCIARLYLKYRNLALLQGILNSLRPAVVALIASAGISILITAFWGSQAAVALANTNWLLVAIFAVCVVLLQKFKMNPIWVMVLAGVIKTVVSLIVSVF